MSQREPALSASEFPRAVEVRVPATSANLGPGFDCLGMALDLWNTVRLERGQGGITIMGQGADYLRRKEGNLVYRAVARLFRHLDQEVPALALSCHNAIPLTRGLGSSAAAVVGGLVAANALCGTPLGQDELLKLACEMEAHPDNVTPALLGGCQIAVVAEDGVVVTSRVALPGELRAVLFVPAFPMPTAKARAVLGDTVTRQDAVFNIGRAALLVNALATGRLELLEIATQDRLHQPQRESIFPQMRLLFRAARQAGALGVFLSGAGSSILALTNGREMTVAYELAEEARKASLEGEIIITKPVQQGATVTAVE
ncbi:MAG: homoserine kinase [Dehalococcoidia bacterium]|nr:homoserine kinase [Dehalococcoidia bacterium]